MITVLDHRECRARRTGAWVGTGVGSVFKGSFVVYVCDLDEGHDGDHVDSHLMISWPSRRFAPA